MRTLFVDVETTGLPGRGVPVHIVQIAWVLDDDGRTRQQGSFIVKPDGWAIPPAVVAIHGIDDAMANEYGIPLSEALAMFVRAAEWADRLVAHNLAFDLRIIDGALRSIGSAMPVLDHYCTMAAAANRLGAGRVKLVDAYRHFTGLALDGAHDAHVDAMASRAVYYGILKSQG
jgi:DNA polymerase-3 subunit epsilon